MEARRCKKKQRKKIAVVSENLLEKRKAYQALRATQAKSSSSLTDWNGSYMIDSWWQQRDRVHLRRLEVKPHGLEVPHKHSLAFVRTIAGLHLRIFSGDFARMIPPTPRPYKHRAYRNEPYELILKQGQAKVKNKTILGHLGGSSTSFMEIAFPRKNFQTISEFLHPFHISAAPPAPRNRVGFFKEVG
ncbi:unnamed protein product [Nyctereutes procyonoides]|uniref:(raccoon dog) hypothetical protein n=1 Tax=Nyctereutes procyonoides TaxID=34880 RepID=A0A811YH02_NYCPR|nr:unnamed protein product [Nyctereutes procyonoides]